MDAKIQNMAKVLHISFFLGMQNRRCCHGLNLRINHHHLSVRKIFGGADREEEWIELVASITTAIQNATTLPVVAEVGEIANSNGEALGAGQWRQVPCALHQGVECDEGCELCLAFPQPCVLGFNSLRSDLLHQLAQFFIKPLRFGHIIHIVIVNPKARVNFPDEVLVAVPVQVNGTPIRVKVERF